MRCECKNCHFLYTARQCGQGGCETYTDAHTHTSLAPSMPPPYPAYKHTHLTDRRSCFTFLWCRELQDGLEHGQASQTSRIYRAEFQSLHKATQRERESKHTLKSKQICKTQSANVEKWFNVKGEVCEMSLVVFLEMCKNFNQWCDFVFVQMFFFNTLRCCCSSCDVAEK